MRWSAASRDAPCSRLWPPDSWFSTGRRKKRENKWRTTRSCHTASTELRHYPWNQRVMPNMADSLDRLFAAVVEARKRSPEASRTSKLFHDGVQKMAKKLVEEATEVGLDAVQKKRESVILESADMLYHLVVVWAECGVTPDEVMGEIDRRERLYGIAEKLPKQAGAAQMRRMTPFAHRRKAAS